jgi:hypothetical protein
VAAITRTIDRRGPTLGYPRAAARGGRRSGFGVIEGLAASAVLAIAVVAVAGPLVASTEHARVTRERGGSLVLARQLMEEIASRPLCNGSPTPLGPEQTENSRSKYDSVDDYHGYRDSTRELKTVGGTAVSAGATAPQYNREVTVQYRTAQFEPSTDVTDFAVVTVKVTSPQGEAVRVSRLFCKHRMVR